MLKIFLSIVNILLVSLFAYGQTIKLKSLASGYSKPVDISNTGIAGDDRIFITEKDGRVKIAKIDGSKLTPPFLDIDAKVNSAANERGLLGLCFHPDYNTNGYFYVHYTNNSGHSTISRFNVSAANPDLADETSEKVLLVVNQPFNNHNAGDLEFGTDGFLYIGMGDGGNGGDPENRSQDPKTLLGKMLRIDVNTETENYLIPNDNPYKSNPDTLPEIWSFGLRNPWRFSIDVFKNEIWIADVGQDKWEEINVAPLTKAAINYGWRCYEGLARFNFSLCNDKTEFLNPIHVYANQFDVGCSVTGGFVYRGKEIPTLQGKYIYADFCTGIFWSLAQNDSGDWINEELADLDNNDFATFGLDINGELYVAGLGSGTVYKIQGVEISNTQNIKEEEHIKFTVKPNPAQNSIEIGFENPAYRNANWQIFSLSDVRYTAKTISENLIGIKIDISSLPSGIYIIKNNINKEFQKFVKL